MPTPQRNWRLEVTAWLAAIALVAAALIFSSGTDEPSERTVEPPAPPTDTAPVHP